MIATYCHQKEQRDERLRLKSSEQQFINLITEGTNCSAYESEAISGVAKQVFALGEYEDKRHLQPGQLIALAVDANEPPGKPMEEYKQVRIVLTLHDNTEDRECRRMYSTKAKRQQQISRMAFEAKDQGALLTQEDLGELLGTDSRTIRRDIKELRERGIIVPTRGQQKDIGPGVSHREVAVRMFIEHKEPLEISRAIMHSIKSVERYIDAFCRVIYGQRQLKNTLKTALVVGVSTTTVDKYLEIYDHYRNKPDYEEILEAISSRGRRYWGDLDFKKKLGRTGRRRT